MWALVGYPLKPVKVTIVRTEIPDNARSTGVYDVVDNRGRHYSVHTNLVFRKKPMLVQLEDEYGKMTAWR